MNTVQLMEMIREYQVGKLSRREFFRRGTKVLGSLAVANSLLAACAAGPNPEPPPEVDDSQPAASPGLSSVEGLAAGIVTYGETEGESLMGYLAH